jgi:two-component system sensor histidine kinase QseC
MAERRAPSSIRRQLLIALLASVVLTLAATTVVSYLDAKHEVDELLDAHLAQSASLLVAQTGRELREIDVEHSPQLHPYGRRVAFQFWENGTVLRLHSANAPNTRLSAQDEGFSDAVADGTRWRVFGAWDAQRRFLVQIGEREHSRNDITATVAKNMLIPVVLALPALGALIWLGIDRAIRPLRLLNQQVASRAPDNLAPIEVSKAPAEVAPLVANLNRLFARVQASIDNERRFTADAAHELRTPLAALRAQAQVARGATGDAERDHALSSVIAGCDRASHLVDQLLTLARLEPEMFRVTLERCDLRAVAQGAIADVAPDALAKGIDVELEPGPPATVSGDARLLAVLVRNLVDNAVRYSPPGTLVRVRVGADGGASSIEVVDAGPGVPPDARAKLGQRFHRMPDATAAGTGLGLSIARRIAELHRARLAFAEGDDGRGLRASVAFAGDAPR